MNSIAFQSTLIILSVQVETTHLSIWFKKKKKQSNTKNCPFLNDTEELWGGNATQTGYLDVPSWLRAPSALTDIYWRWCIQFQWKHILLFLPTFCILSISGDDEHVNWVPR